MGEQITKAELERLRETEKKYKQEHEGNITVEDAEELEIDTTNLAQDIEDEPKEDYYTCSECKYEKITKNMSNCPNCNAKLVW